MLKMEDGMLEQNLKRELISEFEVKYRLAANTHHGLWEQVTIRRRIQ
jgi:hypothetical protein